MEARVRVSRRQDGSIILHDVIFGLSASHIERVWVLGGSADSVWKLCEGSYSQEKRYRYKAFQEKLLRRVSAEIAHIRPNIRFGGFSRQVKDL
jgi:hypothetical protein